MTYLVEQTNSINTVWDGAINHESFVSLINFKFTITSENTYWYFVNYK